MKGFDFENSILMKLIRIYTGATIGYYVFQLLFIGMLDLGEAAICGLSVTLLLVFATVPRVLSLKNQAEKHEAVQSALKILFAFYIVGLVGTLFVGRVDGTVALSERRAYLAAHFSTQVNLTPLATVHRYLDALSRGVIPRTSLRNLLGNAVLMVPMAMLAPCIFPRLRNPLRFTMLTAAILIAIEALQYLLCCGICDVDDIILNLGGALIVYFLFKLPLLMRLQKRMYLIEAAPGENAAL